MKRVKEQTKLPEGVLSVQLFVPDMFGNDILMTRQELRPYPRNCCDFAIPIYSAEALGCWQDEDIHGKLQAAGDINFNIYLFVDGAQNT